MKKDPGMSHQGFLFLFLEGALGKRFATVGFLAVRFSYELVRNVIFGNIIIINYIIITSIQGTLYLKIF